MVSRPLHREWADRTGIYSPEFYAHLGPDETSEALRSVFERHLSTDARVLELGCSSGRHLAHLAEHGFTDLHGVEINDEAFDVMAETFPDLAATGTFYRESIESAVPSFDDGAFDAVFSVETLQHLPPDSTWVFDDLVRVTDDLLVTVEHEGDADDDALTNDVDEGLTLFYRDWNAVFTDRGMAEVDSHEGSRDTRRVFRKRDDDSTADSDVR